MSEKILDYLCNCESEIGNVYDAVEFHCIEAVKIVHHQANGRRDSLASEHQSVDPSREAISILSGKYKRFTFVHPVFETKMNDTAFLWLHFYQQVCMTRISAHTNRVAKMRVFPL